jgi:hypothetical protein
MFWLGFLLRLVIQQFAFNPATAKNIKPIARLRPEALFVADLINNCCKLFSTLALLAF